MIKNKTGIYIYLMIGLLFLSMFFPSGGAVLAEEAGSIDRMGTQFTDVSGDNSNVVYINYLAAKGIMGGFPDGTFRPGDGLTRAQAAVVVSKAANLYVSSDNDTGFKDVGRAYWAGAYIAAAVKAGYLKGFPGGTYRPEAALTRAQAVCLLLRLSKEGDSGVVLPELNDMKSTHWAARSMAMALDAGMIPAPAANSIKPDSPMTREEVSRALSVLLTSDPQLSSRVLYSTLKVKSGEVRLQHGDSGEARLITDIAQVGAGDIVTTGKNGEAIINYPDGSSLLLKRNSTLAVKESQGRAYIKKDGQPGIAVDNLVVELKVGKMFGALSSLALPTATATENPTSMNKGFKLLASKDGKYGLLAAEGNQGIPWYKTARQQKVKVKVDMPWGIAAIRGSFWMSLSNPDGSGSTNLLEGSLSVNARGQSVNLNPGQGTGASEGGTPSLPASMSPQEQSEWAQQASWVESSVQQMSDSQGVAPTSSPNSGTVAGPSAESLSQSLSQAVQQALAQAEQTAASIPASTGADGGHGGQDTPSPTPTPTPSPTISSVTLNAGYYHSLFVTSNNTIKSWGANDCGQLGDGTVDTRNCPVEVCALNAVKQVSGGYQHSLALKSDGTVWAWGCNTSGQLGDGTTSGTNFPIQVRTSSISYLTGIIAICAGGSHSLALKNDGTVWAWGYNGFGELGMGDDVARCYAEKIPSLSNVEAISGRFDFGLALKSDGTVWAWGANGYGQLGDGTTTCRRSPVQVQNADGTNLSGVKAIAGGQDFSLALLNNGTVKAWGMNCSGQLGDGTLTDHVKAEPVLNLSGIVSIDSGSSHSLAVDNSGNLFAWGNNEYGQLGLNDATPRNIPEEVTALSNVKAIACGAAHSLGEEADGSVWTWGNNADGQLGTGSTLPSLVPVMINLSNLAPTASSVYISGAALAGSTLEGHYTYNDNEGDPEGVSTYKWYRGSLPDGSDKSLLTGASGTSYSPVSSDEGYYIFFEVTPRAAAGISTGTAVCSASGSLIAANVSGAISTDTTWDKPLYYVSDDVTVDSAATLTINPGAVVKFASQKGLYIGTGAASERLDAQGTSSDSIIFTDYRDDYYYGDTNGDGGASAAAPGWWSGIFIKENATASISYCRAIYGGFTTGTGLKAAILYKTGTGLVTILHTNVMNSDESGIVLEGATGVTIAYCKVNANKDGIQCIGSNPTITGNEVTGNTNYGILCDACSPNIYTNQIDLNYIGVACCNIAAPSIGGSMANANKIINNSWYGVANEATNVITATYNWWGDPTGPYNGSSNPSGLGNAASDYVDFNDYLTTAP